LVTLYYVCVSVRACVRVRACACVKSKGSQLLIAFIS